MALPEMTLDQLIAKMTEAIDKMTDYTGMTDGFSSSRDGKEGWRESEFKFLKSPEMVYSKVVKNKSNYKSRSQPGSQYLLKDGKIEAKMTGLLSLIPLKVKADDKLAMWHRGERLDQAHLAFVARQAARDAKAGAAALLGTETVDGKEMYVVETKGMDPKKHVGVDSQKVWVDPEGFLGLKIEKYEKGKAVSSWTIKNLKLNTGLKPSDFKMK